MPCPLDVSWIAHLALVKVDSNTQLGLHQLMLYGFAGTLKNKSIGSEIFTLKSESRIDS